MGWTFIQGATRADLIGTFTSPETSEHRRWSALAHCLKGNVLWIVDERVDKDGSTKARTIRCYLLAPRGANGWGYKDMVEQDGPIYHSCPLSYLKLAPETNPDWRASVRAWHAKAYRKVSVGERWSLASNQVPEVRITSLRPLRGVHNGTLYRLKRAALGECLSDLASGSASPSDEALHGAASAV
jgi:hypothetical protein